MNRHGDDSASAPWLVREAVQEDAELLWRWASDPVVRQNSFSPDSFTYEAHSRWLSGKLLSPDSTIYIVERDGEPVGQVRYDRTNDDEAEIDISIAAEERGRGYGQQALDLTKARATVDMRVTHVVGVVLATNEKSGAMFLKAGFVEQQRRTIEGRSCRIFEWRV
jgi:RimJ/RimL family protein N-acetyltransferase